MKKMVKSAALILAVSFVFISCPHVTIKDGPEVENKGEGSGEEEKTQNLAQGSEDDKSQGESGDTESKPDPEPEKEPEPVDPPADTSKITVEGKTYSLAFSDEFEGTDLDYTKWEKCPEWQRQDLGGYWKEDLSYVQDGNLVLEGRMENETLYSGGVRTRGKFQQNKGVYVFRFKATETSGMWSAVWLMTDEEANVGNGAVDGAEIDIIEFIQNDPWESKGHKKYLNSAVHWDGYEENWQHNGSKYYVGDDFAGSWHEGVFLWTDEGYRLWIDGNLAWNGNGSEYGGTCQTENYIKITSEFGTWGGEIDESKLPAKFYVDYIRVYR